MWRREGRGREGLSVGGGGWGGGVRVEISEEEMRIQKGGHHSDSHLFSFSPSHAGMHARTQATCMWLHLRQGGSIFQCQ